MTEQTIEALVESFNKYDHEVADYDANKRYIEFEDTNTNYRSLGDIALHHGFIVSAWNPEGLDGYPTLWFAPITIDEHEIEVVQKTVRNGEVVKEEVVDTETGVAAMRDEERKDDWYTHPTGPWVAEDI